jgi:glycosyltransferase involved in cell wall biosynthesis
MYLPKVLIIGQPFNNKHGGGITLSNLFKGWDKDKIAVAATGHMMYNVTTDVCNIYYQLGIDEHKWRFPFNLVQKKFPSGLISFDNGSGKYGTQNKKGFRYFLVNKVFYPVLEWVGLFHSFSTTKISAGFKEWLREFDPDILYFQVSSRDTILFAYDLEEYLKIPSAIHIMDDWPSSISRKGPLKRYWSRKIEREFKRLLAQVDLCLSISNAMSSEYLKRYNRTFIPFHNPIEVNVWKPYSKTDVSITGDHVKILYSGRIGPGITDSLLEVAAAIDSLNSAGEMIKLYIQSASNNQELINKLQKYDCIIINPVTDYSNLPKVFSDADILIIVNDFDRKGIEFLRYSMPTKASEYMISGTPVLVYAHSEIAVSKFFDNNECGFCVTQQNPHELKKAIRQLIHEGPLRKELSSNAIRLATELFDANKVREDFQQLLKRTLPQEKAGYRNNENVSDNLQLVKVFWTGGYDSTFRIAQLSKLNVIIQPYYLVDGKYRRSVEFELCAVREIMDDIRNHPETKCVIKPLIKVNVSDLAPDREISDAHLRARKEISLGSQYEWLARFAKTNPGIELCLEKNEEGRIFNYFRRSGVLNKITEEKVNYLVIDKKKSDQDLVKLFGDFRFPLELREVTKLDMVNEYRKMGFEDVMNKTWFCHNPVKNEPCGVCNPCKAVVKEGLSFRLTPAGLVRHKTEMKYGNQAWFKYYKKIRWRLSGY